MEGPYFELHVLALVHGVANLDSHKRTLAARRPSHSSNDKARTLLQRHSMAGSKPSASPRAQEMS